MLGVDLEQPRVFHGIPYLDPRHSIYDGNAEMWDLFEAALNDSDKFADAWNKAKDVKGNALGTLSIGLFWIRPERFMPVDAISAPCIEEHYGLKEPPQKCPGEEYIAYMRDLSAHAAGNGGYPAIAYAAWKEKHG